MIGFSIIFLFLLFPWNIFSMSIKTTCDLFKFPRECQCQFNRQSTFNETRLRCRQLTDIKNDYYWSKIPYDRIIFETLNDNITLHRFVFVDMTVRTLRFHAPNLFIQDHTFDHAYIGQLSISNPDTFGRIDFQSNSQIFYDATITNLYFKSIDFQAPISEWIFSNAKIYTFLIEASKFYGFINTNQQTTPKIMTKLKYDDFLEYDYSSSSNRTKLQTIDESSSMEPEQTVIMNITSENYPMYITIYTIVSSINTTNLTENYFPNNFDYQQLEEIELSFNDISSLNENVFQHLKRFQGRLILRNNQIQYIDLTAFDHLLLLKNLSLAKNLIENLSSRHFQDLKRLVELDLSSNQLSQLENNTFEYLSNLEKLYLNYNPIEFIHPDTFSNLTKLKQVHFQGVQFLHLIDQQYFQWLWNLASLHVTDILNTDFELSDVAFCIVSRYNQSIYHLSRQHSCSCNIHYFNLNYNSTDNKYQTNHLRLTPICYDNETNSNIEENNLILHDLENRCDYQLIYLDCDAMTTTTTIITTTNTSEIEFESTSTIQSTTTTTTTVTKTSTTKSISTKKPGNNMKKLFTVLATLAAITICAIMVVFLWYRCKRVIKQRKKTQSFVEQQRHFNSPAFKNHPSTTLRYASSEISGSIYSAQLSTTKSQSEALIEPPAPTIYKNFETNENDPIENFIDDTNKQTVET